MRAFEIGYRLGAATIEQYKVYGIDLEKSSGEKHHGLPLPTALFNFLCEPELQKPAYQAR